MTNTIIKSDTDIKFFVHSIRSIRDICPYESYCVISYTQPGDDPAYIPKNENCIGILRVEVDDVDDVVFAKKYNYSILQQSQAENILNFVRECLDKNVKRIYCHCHAGISRSSGTIGALLKLLKDDDTQIFNNPQYKPNMHIYNTIINTELEKNLLGEFRKYGS